MELKMEMAQTIALSQRMIQSTEILQMGSVELENYIKELATENPVMDLEDGREEGGHEDELLKKLEWLNSSDEQNRVYYSQDYDAREKDPWNFSADAGEDLADYVMSQLIGLAYTTEEMEILNYMALCLDSRGYLTDTPEQIGDHFGKSAREIEKLLQVLKSLDPAGVGAANLRECLLLQMDRLKIEDITVRTVVSEYLELLGKNQLHVIARKMKVPVDEIALAAKVIRGLNPKPGSGFSSREQLRYITPDVVVVRLGGYYEILLNEYMCPKISLNNYYMNLLKENPSREIKTYVTEKLQQAQWIQNCISQRNKTLLLVTKAIIDAQARFFAMGPGNLKPLRLMDIANRLDIHESTVSRAVRDKYMQCSFGVYPLNYFFSKGIAAGAVDQSMTPADVKRCIQEIIAGENKKKPLSDRLIGEKLSDMGIHISRRTVAKYREEAGVRDASGRRAYE